jgi:adenosylcobyric acid synthase
VIHPSITASSAFPSTLPSEAPEIEVAGYEIHFGETRPTREDGSFHPLFVLNGREDGLADSEIRAAGTYLHDAFHNDAFRGFWLNALRRRKGLPERPVADTGGAAEKTYDALAARMNRYLDIDFLADLAGIGQIRTPAPWNVL